MVSQRYRFCDLRIGLTIFGFFTDAFLLRHKIHLTMSTWSPVWDSTEIVETLKSPSGKTTVHLVSAGFIDSTFCCVVSDGSLLPTRYHIDTEADDLQYPRDIAGSWTGSVYSVGDFTFKERSFF